MTRSVPSSYFFGAGKVGKALSRALRSTGARATLRAARRGWPARGVSADVVLLTVRDAQIAEAAATLRSCRNTPAVVLHCAGALGPEELAPLRDDGIAVGQFHPLLAFADSVQAPSLAGAFARVEGDVLAVRQAGRLARAVGMRPASLGEMDPARYHAAAALLANGAAALAAVAGELLAPELSSEEASVVLAPLLASVASNVSHLGMPRALTGPVRRGDAVAVQSHLAALARLAPQRVALYRELCAAQMGSAEAIGEAKEEKYRAIVRVLREAARNRQLPR